MLCTSGVGAEFRNSTSVSMLKPPPAAAAAAAPAFDLAPVELWNVLHSLAKWPLQHCLRILQVPQQNKGLLSCGQMCWSSWLRCDWWENLQLCMERTTRYYITLFRGRHQCLCKCNSTSSWWWWCMQRGPSSWDQPKCTPWRRMTSHDITDCLHCSDATLLWPATDYKIGRKGL